MQGLIYTFHDKYILSASIREDGSSKFASNDRWGTFPAISAAWKLNEENFLKNSKTISELKIRAGYGVTGNQGIGNYQYIPNYYSNSTSAQYPLGSQYYVPISANGYYNNIQWETTKGTNVGIDYGFFNQKITGSIEYYNKNTTNLLLGAPVPAGSNLTNYLTQNIGSLTNKGVEFTINATPVNHSNIKWDLGFNISYNKNNVTKLYGDSVTSISTGGISGGTGNNIETIQAGHAINSFLVNQQVYNVNGAPVEGLYVTQADGTTKHIYKSAIAPLTLGFTTTFTYKKWGLFVAAHGSFGNYVYNNVQSNLDTRNAVLNSVGYVGTATPDVNHTNFVNSQYFSDYYVQNASFLRIDNIALSYNFGRIIDKKINLKISAVCQNAYVFTKYTGIDPEIYNGIDNNIYPKPRIYSLMLNLNF